MRPRERGYTRIRQEFLMSLLAFDKQGKPFLFQRRTKKLLVRLFRNPSARGTCCQVLDGSGQPLYVDPETDYVEFRRAVGQVPGLYRLDQCDEDGNELDDAQPSYVSIEVARNAQVATDASSGDVNPLVIIQQMAAIQADVMKTMAAHQAALLAATADIMRAPYRPAAVAAPAPELRNAGGSEGSDEEEDLDDEIDEDSQPESTLVSVARMVDATMPNMAAQLGEFIYEKISELMNKKKTAAASAAMPAPAAPMPSASSVTPPPVVPASTGPMMSPAHEEVAHTETPGSIISVPAEASVDTGTDDDLEIAAPDATDIPLATPPAPTPAQMAHLFAIRERLDAKERAIAEAAIHRMTPEQLAHWLGELSVQSVEDATAAIRDLIDQIRTNAQRAPASRSPQCSTSSRKQ